MIIKKTKKDDVTILTPVGRLDVTGSDIFEQYYNELFEEGVHNLVVDCSGLEFLSSSGLRVLLVIMNKMSNASGKMVICCSNDHILDVFSLASFDKVIPIKSTIDEAIKTFKK